MTGYLQAKRVAELWVAAHVGCGYTITDINPSTGFEVINGSGQYDYITFDSVACTGMNLRPAYAAAAM